MNRIIREARLLLLVLMAAVLLPPARADDIDIYLGASGSAGAAGAPTVMILVDNSTNWVSDTPQGKTKFNALSAFLDTITVPTNIGLAMLSYNSPSGAYVRFAPRDMSIPANRTAFKNQLSVISADANVTKETGNNKDEPAAFYELFLYFSGLKPRSGTLAQNPYADASGNTVSGYPGSTAFSQGMTSGFAFKTDGTYNSLVAPCGNYYIIYIVANNTAPAPYVGSLSYYYDVNRTFDASPAIPPAVGADGTYADAWARYLNHQKPQITTYVLDAYYPDGNVAAGYSLALQSIGSQGGGRYKHVRGTTDLSGKSDIYLALQEIFAEIRSVNSSFASAALPVDTTNRTQAKNQVFIPMFRPDPKAAPRWMGNLKQYQLVSAGASVALGDSTGAQAVDTLTGFITNCATSFWTTDSGTYWKNVPEIPSPAGQCPTTSYDPFSDIPDGPIVEKGGVAEVIRKGNNPPATNTTPTWANNRTVYTLSGTTRTAFNTTSSGLAPADVNFVLGQDVNDENSNSNTTENRPSLHGDSIHSRPQSVDYGGTTGVVVYYGSNDGMLRAIDGTTGAEKWAFVAPESFSRLSRLRTNSPPISYPTMPTGVTPTPQPKDYYFDGLIGLYQTTGNSKVWIYPTMRRGGRMIYAFDVTDPASPVFKWKRGCPNFTDDTGCTPSMSRANGGSTSIGQTWSMPSVAFIKGASTTTPVVVVGGGYDACEDANTSTPSCGATANGNAVYVFNADTGELIQSFSTARSVVADVAMVDINNDGFVDYAYVADTGGNIYRIDFVDGPLTVNPLGPTSWVSHRVAYTNGAGRKFQFAPALLYNKNKVYLAIGSGDREHPLQLQYPFSPSPGVVNRFYVYADDLTASSASTNLDDTGSMLDVSAGASCSSPQILPSSTKVGWFMDLNQNASTSNPYGEQTVTSALIVSGMVTFSTNRPVPQSAGTCSTVLGEARGYWLNLLNGAGAVGVAGACGGQRSALFVGGGLPPSPVLARVPVDSKTRTVVIGAVQKSGAVSSPIAPQLMQPSISSKRRRVYWYQSGDSN